MEAMIPPPTSSTWLQQHPQAAYALIGGMSVALAVSLVAHVADWALILRFLNMCVVRPRFQCCMKSTKQMRRERFLREHIHHATVTTRDCDLMGHMNNARYPREADFARHALFIACGLFKVCWKRETPLVTAAQTIRYRVELKRGTKFQIRTRVVGWDEGSLYLEQVFTSESGGGGATKSSNTHAATGPLVHAILLVKESVAVGRANKAKFPAPLTSAMDALGLFPAEDIAKSDRHGLPKTQAPPPDVQKWLDATTETSSRVCQ